jgi:hypothetical protein
MCWNKNYFFKVASLENKFIQNEKVKRVLIFLECPHLNWKLVTSSSVGAHQDFRHRSIDVRIILEGNGPYRREPSHHFNE